MTFKLYLFIGVGGIIGAIGRYSISLIFSEISGFPYATLIVNLIGCFLLSFLLNHYKIKQILSFEMISGLGTGLIGAFTTFSTFAMETVELWSNNVFLAFLYVCLNVCGGIGCCYLGFKLANHRKGSDTI